MQLSVIRQIIVNSDFAPVGYELSYPFEKEPVLAPIYSSQDSVICRVLTNAFFGFGRDAVSGGRDIYVNLTNMLLKEGFPELFPPDQLVLEVAPNLFLDEKLADYISFLYRKGYHLLLKSYTPTAERSRNNHYLNLFETVCVDVSKYNRLKVKEFLKLLRKYRVKIMAESVDTPELLAFAQEERFDLLQGKVLGEPEELRGSVPLKKAAYGRLFNHFLTGRVNRAVCAHIISQDPALLHMFFRRAFNNLHNRKAPEAELKRGLDRFTDDQLRHWSAVLLLDQTCHDVSDGTVPQVFRRGLVMERLAYETQLDVAPGRAFLFGIVSALDRVFNEDMETVLSQLTIGDSMRDALLGTEKNGFTQLLNAARSFERDPDYPQLPWVFANLGPNFIKQLLWECNVNTEYIIRALEYTVPYVYQGNILPNIP
ncbi:MAG: hypothetical protein IKN81_02620 [Oscillospiraceae bacterium]|nr:hypothetical protein [Oscillospiraceae bacterium]